MDALRSPIRLDAAASRPSRDVEARLRPGRALLRPSCGEPEPLGLHDAVGGLGEPAPNDTSADDCSATRAEPAARAYPDSHSDSYSDADSHPDPRTQHSTAALTLSRALTGPRRNALS